MAQIMPFSGIHYDPAKVALSDVIAPPYDVLSPVQQDALYARSPYNIVRLMLNKEEPTDDEANNRYTRAAAFLLETLQEGVLVRDESPALYEYIQKFAHPLNAQQIVTRRTLFVALKLEPYSNGVVLPHEETHPKAKADRLNLMRATRANPEPIYGLYEDANFTLARSLDEAHRGMSPLLHAVLPGPIASDSEQHTIYRHTDPCLLSEIEAYLGSRRVWIADGHHRYETGLNYQRERREQERLPLQPEDSDLKPYDYLLIGLSAFEDPGLVVLPTYRMVKSISSARMEELPLQLERFFYLRVVSISEARTWIKQEVPGEKRFALVLADKAYTLTLRSDALADAAHDDGHCEAWRHLDVTILQTFVLDRSLGISWQALAHTPDVAYTRDEEEAVDKVRSGEYQLACLLQNPAVTEVRDVASAGDKMPQKSTFFYPKLWSGLVLRTLEGRQ